MSRSVHSRIAAAALATRVIIVAAVAVAVFAAGCTEKLVQPPPPEPILGVPDSIQQIFTANCAFSSCHGGSTPRQGMGLDDSHRSYLAIVGVAAVQNGSFLRIAPGDSANSYMVMKLRHDPRTGGQPMPLGGYPLDGNLVIKIAAWAQAGAPGEHIANARRQASLFSTSTNVE